MLTNALVLAIGSKRSAEANNKVFKAIAHLCDNPEVVRLLAERDVTTKILDVLVRLTPAVSDAAPAAESGFIVLQKIGKTTKLPSNTMESVIKTLDLFKGKKHIVDVSHDVFVRKRNRVETFGSILERKRYSCFHAKP